MRELVLDIINHRSIVTVVAVIFVIAAFFLARDGVSLADVLILAGIVAVSFAFWRLLTPSPSEEVDNLTAFQDTLRNGQRPTLVEFYSSYCTGCLAVKPVVDRLEAEAGERLQVIRLNIDGDPGRQLLEQQGVLFTPTFVYFDKDGNKIRDSVLVLDRPRILYDLEHA